MKKGAYGERWNKDQNLQQNKTNNSMYILGNVRHTRYVFVLIQPLDTACRSAWNYMNIDLITNFTD